MVGQIRGYAMFTLSVVLLSASCLRQTVKTASENRTAPGDNRHWAHDERLRAVMTELEQAAATDWPQELQGDVNSARPHGARLAEAVDHAIALGDAAKRLSETASRLSVPEVDRRSFIAQAETLFDQATRLENATRGGDIRGMRTVLADIDCTCQSCHTRFRDISGPLARR